MNKNHGESVHNNTEHAQGFSATGMPPRLTPLEFSTPTTQLPAGHSSEHTPRAITAGGSNLPPLPPEKHNSDPDDRKDKTSKKRLYATVGGIAAGAVLVAGGVGAWLGLKGGESNGPAPTDPSETSDILEQDQSQETPDVAPAAPSIPIDVVKNGTELSAADREALIKEIEIPAGLTATEWANQFVDRLNKWDMAGANEDYYQNVLKANIPVSEKDQIRSKLAEMNKVLYTDALFVPNWETNQRLVNASQFKATGGTLALIHQWAINHNEDQPDYEQSTSVTKVQVLKEDPSSGTRTIQVTGIEHNNGNEVNRDAAGTAANNGLEFTRTWTTQIVDGTERIANWE
ncbi:hypothetical protein [Pseudoclavibacter sp. CFCC 11306]|uniref:hypothetical protein n=1 Tax=Pseudoclavibacter sp. CFCC 11306 TaxID=1564493 RepID=UPI001300E015|nr:hypothetical protein [Pseudoclavibacter sp. CFCC 11306]KAB1658157.1 hypothetical protein F8O09_00540 [Pseudoclavibacter sp. CFCC 11306]